MKIMEMLNLFDYLRVMVNNIDAKHFEKTIKSLFILAIIIVSHIGCKKISAPNEDAQKLFGQWDYQSNSGGYSGGGGSTRFCRDCWVEITDKGCFIVYEGSNKISKTKFKIEMKTSIYSAPQRPALVYRNSDYETYQIFGDTLLLSDEAYDGYSYVFVRK